MKYRTEIDGLRALAVVPVVLYHAGATGFGGGYVGVDVFFVISGYLISLIIFAEMQRNDFSLLGFYERRARRILPALFTMLLLVSPVAWLVMMPHQLKDYGQSLVAVSFFSGNVLFWLESGYFELASELKPLLHTWSLAVEEQFYFVYPISVVLIWKLWRRALPVVLCLVVIASFVTAQRLAGISPDANFYLPFSRAWEMGLGALCAWYVLRRDLPTTRYSDLLALSGVLMIVGSIVLMTGDTPFPGIYAVPAVVGTSMVLLFASATSRVGRLLSWRPFVGIGLISYSLYLWHFPIFALARLWLNDEPGPLLFTALIALSVLLAYLSFHFVEAPFRNKRRVGRGAIFAGALIGSAAFVAAGYQSHVHNGFADYKFSRIDPARAHLLVDIERERARRREIWTPLLAAAARPFDASSRTKVLILGDSVAQDLFVALTTYPELEDAFEFRHLQLDDVCMGDLETSSSAGALCAKELTAFAASQLPDSADLVLVTSTWQQHTVMNIRQVVGYFRDREATLRVFGSANFNDMASLSYQIARQEIEREQWGRFFASNKREDWSYQNERLQNVLVDERTTYLSKYAAYCEGADEQQTCTVMNDSGAALIYDTGHVTVEGAAFLGRRAVELDWLVL